MFAQRKGAEWEEEMSRKEKERKEARMAKKKTEREEGRKRGKKEDREENAGRKGGQKKTVSSVASKSRQMGSNAPPPPG